MNAGQTLGWVERGEGIMCLAMKLWLLDRLCVTLSLKPKTHLFFAANLKTDQFFFQKISDYVGARIMWEYKKSSNNQSQNCANLTPFFFLGIFYRYRQHIFFKDFLADGVFCCLSIEKRLKMTVGRMSSNDPNEMSNEPNEMSNDPNEMSLSVFLCFCRWLHHHRKDLLFRPEKC